jgi:hypothetical protein
VNPEIHDIFIKRIGFSLIRVHRIQSIRVNNQEENLLLNGLKWPIETLYFGVRPACNIDTSSTKSMEDWHLYSSVTDANVDTCAIREFPPPLILAAFAGTTALLMDAALGFTNPAPALPAHNPMNGAGVILQSFNTWIGGVGQMTVAQINTWLGYYGYPLLVAANFANPLVPTAAEMTAQWPSLNTFPAIAGDMSGGTKHCQIRYKTMVPTIYQVKVEAHGVPLYNELPSSFFNSYVPFTYGGTHINTPFDIGAYMLTFNLYPGVYQPSGHVNVSRAREFYFGYKSTSIGGTIPTADLVVIGIAINFLLISDGSAVLRYTT